MKSAAFMLVLGAMTLMISFPYAWAGDVAVNPEGAVTWQAGVNGVEIEWNPNGSVKRIYSRYSTPVEFDDRRGIAKAQIIAEEKAKGEIIRFMQQSVASTRVVAEVESDLNKATQQRSSGTPAAVQKTDERTLIETLTEITVSFAAGTLRGVVVLEKGYDDKAEEAWVVVGISEKTLRAASVNRLSNLTLDRRPILTLLSDGCGR